MRKRAVAARIWKGRLPVIRHRSSRVLARFGFFAKIAQHRVNAALQRNVSRADRLLHPLPFSSVTQALELCVGIENECRPRETAGDARAVCMHADNIKGLPCETEREMRIVWIRAHLRVPISAINVVKLSKLQPKAGFKFSFR